jgi:hypothetical protein
VPEHPSPTGRVDTRWWDLLAGPPRQDRGWRLWWSNARSACRRG